MRHGPRYLLVGSRLTDDTLVLRALLTGLNSQGREWQEMVQILDNGSLKGLKHEVNSGFKFLEHHHVEGLDKAQIVIAFMDRLSHNRDTEKLLRAAENQGTPTFVISRYGP